MWVANAIGWAVLAALGFGALVLADRLGFIALVLIGAAAAFVCTQAELRERAPPGYGSALGQNRRLPTPEERAANAAQGQPFIALLRFYRRCGLALAGIGAAGFTWQAWFPNTAP